MAQPKTLFDKIWDSHLVETQDDGTCLIYIARHLVHEVTSPQAFEGLRMTGRTVRRPDATLAVADHNVPPADRSLARVPTRGGRLGAVAARGSPGSRPFAPRRRRRAARGSHCTPPA